MHREGLILGGCPRLGRHMRSSLCYGISLGSLPHRWYSMKDGEID